MWEKKNVMWIFSYPKPQVIPSYVVSGIMPADFLKIQKVIFLANHNPEKFLFNYKPKLIIVNKAFHSKVLDLVKESKKLNIRVISVFDDWHFNPKNNNTKTQFKLYENIAKNSDKIVVKTKFASNLIEENIGIKSEVISDCLRFKHRNVINKINFPLLLSWFGMHTNHDTLEYGLNQILDCGINCKIKIITNEIEKLSKKIYYLNKKNISMEYIKWTPKMDEDVLKSDIVIIPYLNDKKRLVKSYNRIIDSINLGRFTIVSDLNVSRKFEKYCYLGNIGEGLIWTYNNEKKALEKVKRGVNFVKKEYNLESISSRWSNLIDSLI